MYSCSIHTNIHPMLGVDWHLGTPGPPVVPFPMPHFVAQFLGGLPVVGSAKLAPTVLSHNFITLNQGSDIGMGIGHVASNILFPIYVLTSGSVSCFGSFSVLSSNQPTAAAVGVYVNPNLNCAQPLNMPTGLVVAPGCNMVGMSLADILAGAISMALNMAISLVVGAAGGKVFGKVTEYGLGAIANIAGRFSVSAGLTTTVFLSTDFVTKVSEEVVGAALGQFLAGPSGAFGDWVSDGVNEQLIPNYSQGELLE